MRNQYRAWAKYMTLDDVRQAAMSDPPTCSRSS